MVVSVIVWCSFAYCVCVGYSAINTINTFDEMSGLKINIDKTKAIWIALKIEWQTKEFEVLGIRFITDLNNLWVINTRKRLDEIYSQEITMSIVTPGELWKESGRWDGQEGLMLKMEDRAGRDVCISPTNEEAVTDIFRKSIRSYKICQS